jgi:hypothetical protein
VSSKKSLETKQIPVGPAAQIEPLWDDEGCARFLSISAKTLPRWRVEGRGPPFLKLSRGRSGLVRYRPSDVIEWVNSQLRRSTSDPGEASQLSEQP